MNKYTLTFLLPNEEEVKTIKDIVSLLKGTILSEEKWGGKTLAYPIKKNSSAFYFNYSINMDSKNVLELRKKLNFNEKLIRYLLLKSDSR